MSEALKLGIAGLGTVGVGVLDMLAANRSLIEQRCGRIVEVNAVCARDRNRDRGGHDLSGLAWFDTAQEMAAQADIDVFVELMGGEGDPAKASVEAALTRGLDVVTANKALLAHHGTSLARLADERGVALNYEAAIAGGIPIVKTMRENLVGNSIRRVYGILNGTCNYILTRMADEELSFEEVLQDAQALGYAEADPTFDVGGFDAAHKLACLTSLAFGTEVSLDDIYIEGIEAVGLDDIRNAERLGYKIKLLGVAVMTPDGVEQRVHPTLVAKDTPIGAVDGVFNAVAVDGDFVDRIMLQGRGAGAHPTASSVLADICDIARGIRVDTFAQHAHSLAPYKRARMRAHRGGYYVSMGLFDKPGEVAAVAGILAAHDISLESIVQSSAPDTKAQGSGTVTPEVVSFVLITHDTTEIAMRTALEEIAAKGHAATASKMIRIERF